MIHETRRVAVRRYARDAPRSARIRRLYPYDEDPTADRKNNVRGSVRSGPTPSRAEREYEYTVLE